MTQIGEKVDEFCCGNVAVQVLLEIQVEISRGLLDRRISNSGGGSVKSYRIGNHQHIPLEVNGVIPTLCDKEGRLSEETLESQTVCLQQTVVPK